MRVYCHRRRPIYPRGGGGVHPQPSVHSPHSARHSFSGIVSYLPPSSQSIVSQMPDTQATSSSSSRFQAIFEAALKSYQRQTKNDLLEHPLATQFQSCNSTDAVLAILQGQVQEFDKSRSGDTRLTKWLSPTINVLSAFSATISGGVSLACLDPLTYPKLLTHILQVFSPANVIFTGIGVLLSVSILSIAFGRSISYQTSHRRPRELRRVKTFSLSCSNVSGGFLHDSKRIQRWLRLRQ